MSCSMTIVEHDLQVQIKIKKKIDGNIKIIYNVTK